MSESSWIKSDKQLPERFVWVEVDRGFGIQRFYLDEGGTDPRGYWTSEGWNRCHVDGTKWRPIPKSE